MVTLQLGGDDMSNRVFLFDRCAVSPNCVYLLLLPTHFQCELRKVLGELLGLVTRKC